MRHDESPFISASNILVGAGGFGGGGMALAASFSDRGAAGTSLTEAFDTLRGTGRGFGAIAGYFRWLWWWSGG